MKIRILTLLFCISVVLSGRAFASDITLAWDPVSSPKLAGYKLYYGTASNRYDTSINVGARTSYTVTGLQPGTYYFAVTAYDTSGLEETDYSNEVSSSISAETPVISNVQVTILTSDSATIHWDTDLASDSEVRYGTTTAYGKTVSSTSMVKSHNVNLGGLSANTLYNFQVRSKTSSGGQAASENSTFKTLAGDPTLTVSKSGSGSGTVTGSGISCGSDCSETVSSGASITLTATPASGSVFAGWAGGSCSGTGSCTVTVTANTTVTAAFNNSSSSSKFSLGDRVIVTADPSLRVRSAPLLTGSISGNQPVNALGTVVGGPISADGYIFWQINYDQSPDGWSIEGSNGQAWLAKHVAPPSDTQSPSVPSNLVAQPVSTSQINLSWSASTDNTGVTGYRVERCAGSACTNYAQIAAPAGTSYSDSALSANTTYRYRVRAIDAAGNISGYCSAVNATTLPASYTLTITKSGTGSGTVAGAGISCGSDCSETVSSGTSIALTAAPASGSTFAGWSGGCSGTGSCTVTLSGNVAVTATFNAIPTPAADATPPVISGVTTSSKSKSEVAISWKTNEGASSQVEYGTTTAYGSRIALEAALVTSHSQVLKGLRPNTTYHFRIISRDAAGNTATSGDFTFTTPKGNGLMK